MVIARPINPNMSCKLHPYSLQRTWSPQGPRLLRRIGNMHLRNYFLLLKKEKMYIISLPWGVIISLIGFCVSFSRTDAGLCIYYLFVWSNFSFLFNSRWITLPTQSCLVFSSNLLHSLIIWSVVSSLSPHNLHLLFCCVLSILVLIWLVLMTFFCAAIRGDSVSLLR